MKAHRKKLIDLDFQGFQVLKWLDIKFFKMFGIKCEGIKTSKQEETFGNY